MATASALARIRAAFRSALNPDSTRAANRTREWLSQNYNFYPTGIERVYKSNTSVQILLSDPLDVDMFASAVESEELETEVVEENGKRLVSLHYVNKYPSGRIQRVLAGTFHESRNIPVGRNPIKSGENTSNDRLRFLVRYLEKDQRNNKRVAVQPSEDRDR